MKAIAALFDILPGWVWALITAGALAAAGISQTQFTNEREAHAETRTKYAEQVAQAEAATRAESEKNRAIEQELRNAQETNEQQAQALLAAVDHAVTVDRLASERLRDAAEDAAAIARSRCAASTTPGSGETGTDIIGLLAELLGDVDEAAGIYAAEADASRIRGLTCEAEYNRAREAIAG